MQGDGAIGMVQPFRPHARGKLSRPNTNTQSPVNHPPPPHPPHLLPFQVGTHGIWIEYELENGKTTTATYLPEVMPEQNWSKVEAIDSLLRKGGYRATPTEAVRRSIRLTRYQSEKGAMTYAEWAALRGLTSS